MRMVPETAVSHSESIWSVIALARGCKEGGKGGGAWWHLGVPGYWCLVPGAWWHCISQQGIASTINAQGCRWSRGVPVTAGWLMADNC